MIWFNHTTIHPQIQQQAQQNELLCLQLFAFFIALLCAGLGDIGHFVDIINRHESGGILLGQEAHQRGILLLVDDHNDLLEGGVVVSTDRLIDGRTAVQVIEYKTTDLIELGGQDADAALNVVAEDEIVEDDAVEVSTEDTERNDLQIGNEVGHQRNDQTAGCDRLAQIDTQVLIEQLADDIQTAGGGVDIEQRCLAEAHQKQMAQNILEGVADNRLEIGQQDLVNTKEHRQDQGGVDRLDTKTGSQTEETCNQKHSVDRKRDQRDGDRAARHLTEDHGKTGHATDGNSTGDHKDVERETQECGCEGDDNKFFNNCELFHRILPLIFYSSSLK